MNTDINRTAQEAPMKAAGIIAEYNPLHNGHAYQLAQVKKETDADYVIVAMSGDFLQRGTPAIADKYTRTQMALAAGADLVLEIPVRSAVSSAEYFASAGVLLLGATGVVNTVCYGCESVQPQLAQTILAALLSPDAAYEAQLAGLLRSGVPYPLARQEALCTVLPDEPGDKIRQFLSAPNNILALEYEKAIALWNAAHNTPLAGHAMLRIGSGYHDTELASVYPSATAIRNLLLPPVSGASRISALSAASKSAAQSNTESNASIPACPDKWNALRRAMPQTALALLQDASEYNRLMNTDDFSEVLYASLLAHRSNGYTAFADCPPALSNRICDHLNEFVSFTQFAGLLKTKDLTYTRIQRVLAHIMLGLTTEDCKGSAIPYIRVLGFAKGAQPLLSAVSKKASAPLLTRIADASYLLSENAMHALQKDLYAADLYRGICSIKSGQALRNEYTQPLIVYTPKAP